MAIYLAALLFGAVLLGASLWHGGGDTDAHDGDAHGEDAHGFGLLLSLRFWTFGLSFFGLTGTILGGLSLLNPLFVPWVAGGVGLGCGLVAARLLRRLTHESVGALQSDHTGREGRLLLPVSPGQPGKLRVQIGGVDTDLVASRAGGPDAEPIPAGRRVLIVEMRGTTAVVEPVPADLPAGDD